MTAKQDLISIGAGRDRGRHGPDTAGEERGSFQESRNKRNIMTGKV